MRIDEQIRSSSYTWREVQLTKLERRCFCFLMSTAEAQPENSVLVFNLRTEKHGHKSDIERIFFFFQERDKLIREKFILLYIMKTSKRDS